MLDTSEVALPEARAAALKALDLVTALARGDIVEEALVRAGGTVLGRGE